MLVVDRDACRLWELSGAYAQNGGPPGRTAGRSGALRIREYRGSTLVPSRTSTVSGTGGRQQVSC